MPDYATLYIADPSMLGSRFLKHFPEIKSYKSVSNPDGTAKGLVLTVGNAVIRLNFMAETAVPSHLAGFAGFAKTNTTDPDLLTYVLARIHHVRMVIGCVIEPALDEASEEFLLKFNSMLNGLAFANDTIMDFDSTPLCGALANTDPNEL